MPFVVISIFTTALLGISNFYKMSSALYETLETRSTVMTSHLVNELVDPLSMGEYDRMQAILNSAQKLDESFFYAVVVAADGRVLASTDPSFKNLRLDRDEFEKSALKVNELIRRETGYSNVFETVTPVLGVNGEKGAFLRAGFSTDSVLRVLQSSAITGLLIGAMTILGGIFLYAFIIGKGIVKPIGAIAVLATRIAEGDLSETVKSSRADEIGQLLRSEAEMVRCLREVADVAESIANGDSTVKVTPRSKRDVFGRSLEKMVASLNERTKQVSQLAAIVEFSEDAIISITADGQIVSWNRGAETLLGFDGSDVVDMSVYNLLPPDEYSYFSTLVDLVVCGESLEPYETENIRKDGSRVHVAVGLSPVKGADDKGVAVSLIARDITHKRIVEERMREFYSIVSHELRTPLTSIRGALSLIESGIIEASSKEGSELILIARASTERLGRLINDILDLRKIESGQLELDISEIDSTELAKNVVEAMEPMARERGVTLRIELSEQKILAVDVDRAMQVMTNLLSNAIKYSDRGMVIRISNIAPGNKLMFRFAISDQGPGIPEEARDKLFQKFQQVDSSDTRAKEGSGLGLAISKAIVEQHEGSIGFESKLGAGTMFWFELPIKVIVPNPKASGGLERSAGMFDGAELVLEKIDASRYEGSVQERR